MAALSNSFVSSRDPRLQFLTVGKGVTSNKLVIIPASQRNTSSLKSRREFTVRASGDDGRPSSGGRIFVGGFVLGGVVVGALGCIFAPQISKALAETDRKDLMRKLPKFIYDEDKALERTRKVLSEKIEQLNAAIDSVSSQLRADDASNGSNGAADAVMADKVEEASI